MDTITNTSTVGISESTATTRSEHSFPNRGGDSTILRVAYLVSEYPALSHTFIKKEIEWLERSGHEVEIVSVRQPRNLGVLGQEGQKDRDRTFYLLRACVRGFLPALARLVQKRANLQCMFSTWLRVVRKRPFALSSYAYGVEAIVLVDWMLRHGIEHTHNHFGNAAGTVALIAGASHLVTYSLSIHGPDIFYDVEDELLPLKLSSCKFARAISHYCRSQMCLQTEAKHWPRFEIVRCGIDPKQFSVREEPKNDCFRILCVGRLVAAKGQSVLLEAAGEMRDRGERFDLVFVGTGPDEESLKKQVVANDLDEYVSFTGGLDPIGVRDQYAKADLFVLPSFAEGVPIVLMEAMASGVPVISTRITGIPELIESGEDGILVAPSDAKALAEAVTALSHNLPMRDRFAKAGREKVCSIYNLENNGPEMAKLFEKHLN